MAHGRPLQSALRRGLQLVAAAWLAGAGGSTPAVAGGSAPGQGAVAVAAAATVDDLAIDARQREFLKKQIVGAPGTTFRLIHAYYAEDPATRRGYSGWSNRSAWDAFTFCRRSADKAGVAAPCLPLLRHSVVVARSYAEARARAGTAALEPGIMADPHRCGQEPGDRYFWIEHGWCDMAHHGPRGAEGLVIWNHGIRGTHLQYTAPPALAMRLLQARGWDVVALKRNSLAEDHRSHERALERLRQEVDAARASGYRKVVVAGQSFGGRLALEYASVSDLAFTVVAMAPGRARAGTQMDEAFENRNLADAKAERVAVVYPKGDALFGNPDRGLGSRPVLERRGKPYLLLDETAGLSGHGGGTGGNFAFRYGLCLAAFLSAPQVAAGPYACADGRRGADQNAGLEVARELLPPRPRQFNVVTTGQLGGVWYGVLGETIIAWSLVETAGSAPSVLYRWAYSWGSGGGVYQATVDGSEVSLAFPNKATLTVRPLSPARLGVTLSGFAGDGTFGQDQGGRLEGELARAPADL